MGEQMLKSGHLPPDDKEIVERHIASYRDWISALPTDAKHDGLEIALAQAAFLSDRQWAVRAITKKNRYRIHVEELMEQRHLLSQQLKDGVEGEKAKLEEAIASIESRLDEATFQLADLERQVESLQEKLNEEEPKYRERFQRFQAQYRVEELCRLRP